MRACAALLLLAAAAPAGDDLDALVADLGSETYAVRDRAYQLLVQRKDARVIPLVERRIADWPPENQYRALLVIAVFPPKQSHPPMRRMLKSADPHLRICAATQLHRRGERDMERIIVETLREPVPEEKLRSIAGRLGYLKLPAVYEAWAALLTPERDELTIGLWFASFSSEEYEGAQAQAKRILAEDKRDRARATACAYLIRCRDASCAPELAALVRKGSLDSSAAARIRYILQDGRIYPREVCEAMLERLPDETNTFVAKYLIEILAAAQFHPARKRLGELIEHENAEIAEAALGALAALDGVPETAVVRRMLLSKEPSRQLMAARILRRMDDASGFDAVLRIAKETQQADLRRDAIQILGEFRRAAAMDVLIDALGDDDSIVRSYASSALTLTLRTIFPYRQFDLRTAGYADQGTPAERAAAVAKIRAWWTGHRDAEW